jgi:hypothetical protein
MNVYGFYPFVRKMFIALKVILFFLIILLKRSCNLCDNYATDITVKINNLLKKMKFVVSDTERLNYYSIYKVLGRN